MILKTLYPDASDLRLVELAIRSFPNAGGNVDRAGRLSESVDPNRLWLMISVSAATMATLWVQAGVSTSPESSYADMQKGIDHTVNLSFFKVKKSWFRSAWVGNVSLLFDRSTLTVGFIAGRDQPAMWRQFRAFLDLNGKLYDSAATALAAARPPASV
jgi:hypothetical protein